MQQISLQYFVWFRNYNCFNLKVHFSKCISNYVLNFDVKQHECFSLAQKFTYFLHVSYYKKQLTLFSVSCKSCCFKTAEDCFVGRYVMICERRLRGSYHLATDFDRVAAAGGHFWSLFQYCICSWHSSLKFWTFDKKLCKVRFVICVYSMCSCMFIWKSELWSLNCCVTWAIKVMLIKCAGHVMKILAYKIWKFGWNP